MFKQRQINYLGELITENGVDPDPEKVKAIAEMKVPSGSKRHNLQAVEPSLQTKTAVQIVLNLPAPSNGGLIYRFLGMPAMRTGWMAGAAAHKSG